jgi:acetyl-CoA carboxylase biotin carboxyl carrier protein
MNPNPAVSPEEGAESRNEGAGRGHIVDLDFLRGLIAAVDQSGIDSVEISRAGTRIRVAKSPSVTTLATSHGVQQVQQAAPAAPAAAPAAAEPAPPPESKLVDVVCPMVGTFYRSPAPEAPPYVELGSRVVKGQTLCILEAMKLMNELEAEVQGVVREICVENAEPVEYGQVLFRIEPDA